MILHTTTQTKKNIKQKKHLKINLKKKIKKNK
jgi:hypothetical protein